MRARLWHHWDSFHIDSYRWPRTPLVASVRPLLSIYPIYPIFAPSNNKKGNTHVNHYKININCI